MRLIAILCVFSAALAIVGADIPGAIGQAMLYLAGLVAGGMLVMLGFAYREAEREKYAARRVSGLGFHRFRSRYADNPRCFCPDCGADLGNFYSNRIQMERVPRCESRS
jgi:hypothetical protein